MSAGKVKGFDEVMRNLNREVRAIKTRTLAGLMAAGLLIERESKPLVPVDTGNLKNSGYTRKAGARAVEVGYAAAYAVYVHENLEAHHDNGQAKFLQVAVERNHRAILETVREHAEIR